MVLNYGIVLNQSISTERKLEILVCFRSNILHAHVTKKTSAEYIKQLSKVLKPNLNGGNKIKAINTVPI